MKNETVADLLYDLKDAKQDFAREEETIREAFIRKGIANIRAAKALAEILKAISDPKYANVPALMYGYDSWEILRDATGVPYDLQLGYEQLKPIFASAIPLPVEEPEVAEPALEMAQTAEGTSF